MRIVLATSGTWGDVQPLALLGGALQARGHEVVLCSPPDSADRVAAMGVPAEPMGHDARAYLTKHAALLTRPASLTRLGMEYMRQEGRIQLGTLLRVVEGADLFIGTGVLVAGRTAAERHGVPFRFLSLAPQMIPSRAHPPFPVPWHFGPGWLNALYWRVFLGVGELTFKSILGELRDLTGLGPIPAGGSYRHVMGTNLVVASDPEIAPIPDDVPVCTVQPGAIVASAEGALPEATEAFLAAGPPPIYVGFGSMPDEDPAWMTRTVIEAAERARVRVVLAKGWSELGDGALPDSVHAVGHVPHALLFPRMAGVVHHGGAGTLAAAAHAGVPQLVVPYLFDQFYWRARLVARGAAVHGPSRRGLGVKALAGAFERLARDEALRERARGLGAEIAERTGVRPPVELVADALLA